MIVWLNIEVNIIEYKKLVKHITDNMFFGIKRISTNLRHILFHSIGDAMHDDLQDFEHAEIFIEQKIDDKDLEPDIIKEIIKNDKWYIRINYPSKDIKKYFLFIVDKESDLILFREEKNE